MNKNISKIKQALADIAAKWKINIFSEHIIQLDKEPKYEGGQGKVYLGYLYNIRVIVKILIKHNTENYITEAINAYKYRHPSIPKFLGAYMSQKQYGIVFEFVDGVTLNKLIQAEKNINKGDEENVVLLPVQKLDYLVQIANVIEFFHDNNLLHRDLKTENIIIDRLGRVKLIDFGIAFQDNKLWAKQNMCLTAEYKAPEIWLQQLEEEDVADGLQEATRNFKKLTETEEYRKITACDQGYTDQWLYVTNKYDVWTFGVIMAVLLTRCNPWCKSEKEKIEDDRVLDRRMLQAKAYPLQESLILANDNLPYKEDLKAIIKACLTFDYEKRPTIKEIKQKLVKVFSIAVQDIEKDEVFKKYQRQSLDYQQISRDLLTETITKDFKREVIRNKKIINRVHFPLEQINSINQILTSKESESNVQTLPKGLQVLMDIMNNRKKKENESSEFMLDRLKQLNLKQDQKLQITLQKIDELQEKCQKMESTAMSSSTVIKKKSYVFMTFDEIDYSILAYEFYPDRNMMTIPINADSISRDFKKTGYRSPACLNFEDKLFIIGGLKIQSRPKKDPNEKPIQYKSYYSDNSGLNYQPTDAAYCFDYKTKKIKILEELNLERYGHSLIVFRFKLLVIGGRGKHKVIPCEYLELRNEKWTFDSITSPSEVLFEPLLMNFNDEYVLAIQIDQTHTQLSINTMIVKDGYMWTKETIQIGHLLFDKVIQSLDAIFCSTDDSNNKLLLFGNCFNKFEKKESNVSSSSSSALCMCFEIAKNRDSFSLSYKSHSLLRLQKTQIIVGSEIGNMNLVPAISEDVDFLQSFCIYNGFSFYEYDEELFYFAMNRKVMKAQLRSIDMRLIKFTDLENNRRKSVISY